MERDPKMDSKIDARGDTFSRNDSSDTPAGLRFLSFFATLPEDKLMDAFWSPLGSLLAPFGIPLAYF